MDVLNKDNVRLKYDNLCLRYYYLDCDGKAIYYHAVCFIVVALSIFFGSTLFDSHMVSLIVTLTTIISYIIAAKLLHNMFLKRAMFCRAVYRNDKSEAINYVEKYNSDKEIMLNILLLDSDEKDRWNMPVLVNQWFFKFDYGHDEIANFIMDNNDKYKPYLSGLDSDMATLFLAWGNHYKTRDSCSKIALRKFMEHEVGIKEMLASGKDIPNVIKNIDYEMHSILSMKMIDLNLAIRLVNDKSHPAYSHFYTIDDFYDGLKPEVRVGVLI